MKSLSFLYALLKLKNYNHNTRSFFVVILYATLLLNQAFDETHKPNNI